MKVKIGTNLAPSHSLLLGSLNTPLMSFKQNLQFEWLEFTMNQNYIRFQFLQLPNFRILGLST